MRRVLSLVLGTVLALAGLFGMSTGAEAKPPCETIGRTSGKCSWTITKPGSPGSSSGSDSVPAGSDSSPNRDSGNDSTSEPPRADDEGSPACLDGDKPVPCRTEQGYWRQDVRCYISPRPADPQPEPGHSMWQHFEDMFNRGPDTGAVYPCFDAAGEEVGLVYSPNPPAQADPPPTPGEVARRAVAQMNLEAITIGIAPEPPATAVVSVPVWLWVDGPGAGSFGTQTATATLEGVTVTATATADEVRWDLGDGTTISCGAGTPYEPRFGGEASPDCGHTYSRESGFEPGGAYTVTATTTWVVQWEGAGQSGTITMDPLVAQTQIVVAEGQVLVS